MGILEPHAESPRFNSSILSLAAVRRGFSEKAFGWLFSTIFNSVLFHKKKTVVDHLSYSVRVIQKCSPFLFAGFFHV